MYAYKYIYTFPALKQLHLIFLVGGEGKQKSLTSMIMNDNDNIIIHVLYTCLLFHSPFT